MLTHSRNSGGVGAIYPSMMYVVMMLDLLGYPEDHPDRKEALTVHESAGRWTERPRFFFQPCFSVVWDTAIAAYALGEAGEGTLRL